MAEKEGEKRGIILSLLMVSSADMMPGFKMFLFLCALSFIHQGKKKRRLEPFSVVSETKCTQ